MHQSELPVDVDQVVKIFGRNSETLRLQRPALTINYVKEYNGNGVLLWTLGAGDYQLLFNGRTLQRLQGGLFAYSTWGDIVEVSYTPQSEQILRDRVVVDLVKLAIVYNGLSEETVGDYKSKSYESYHLERERLLLSMGSSRGFRFA